MFFPAGLPSPSPSIVIETGLLLIGRFLKSSPVTILRVSSPLSKLICIPDKAFAAALVTKSTVTVLLTAAIPNTVPVRVVLASVTVNWLFAILIVRLSSGKRGPLDPKIRINPPTLVIVVGVNRFSSCSRSIFRLKAGLLRFFFVKPNTDFTRFRIHEGFILRSPDHS